MSCSRGMGVGWGLGSGGQQLHMRGVGCVGPQQGVNSAARSGPRSVHTFFLCSPVYPHSKFALAL